MLRGSTNNGTASGGNAGFDGVVFRVKGGNDTVLHTFCTSDCSDGALPESGLVQGLDGALYGIASAGGCTGCAFC